jgi:hypothetical protein
MNARQLLWRNAGDTANEQPIVVITYIGLAAGKGSEDVSC